MLKHCVAPAVAILLALPASAAVQQYPTGQTQPQDQQRMEQRQDTEMIIRADRLIGQAVRDRKDERLGRIDDLALHVNENRIGYAVIARGGLFGVGAEHVAVPWKQIQPDLAERVVRLEGTEADLQQARRIDTRTTWPADITRPVEGEPDRPVATTGPGAQNVLSVSRLIGMDVQNEQGERLGQIDDMTINRDGSLGYAVVAHGGFLGMGHSYVAIPWDRFKLDAQQERVVLNVTRQQLEAAKPFEYQDRWPTRVDWPFTGR